jgi:hypothetical protein
MFQQFYEPHPALKGFVNNIMIHQVEFDRVKDRPNFSIPPLPEHCLFFYVRDRSNAVNTANLLISDSTLILACARIAFRLLCGLRNLRHFAAYPRPCPQL